MTILKCKPLKFNVAPQARYKAALLALVKQMHAQTKREVLKLFDDHAMPGEVIGDASIASQGRILVNQLDKTFAALFGRKAKDLADKMIGDTLKTSAGALKESVSALPKDLSGGLAIKLKNISPTLREILKASATENVALIKSIQSQYHEGIRQAVMRSITSGEGRQAVIDHLTQVEGKTENRAKLIADDQTRKIYASVNKYRMIGAGMDKYIWNHSGGGQTPRPMHEELDGQECSYENPPVIDEDGTTGNPGELINCRCVCQPFLDLGDDE